MDVSIIIVNYNTCGLTKDCIDSIFDKSRDFSFEVILVDNASSDGSRGVFTNDSRIKYYYLDENIGFGKANNYGIDRAKGKYVFCLNSDTILCNNAIKCFFDFCENNNQSIGAVGGLLRDKQGNVIHSFADFPEWTKILYGRLLSPIFKLFGKKYTTLDDPMFITGDTFMVDYVTGADLFVRRDLLVRYGAFDPDFFMYFEETELQYRLTSHGYRSFIISTPQIIHLEGQSVKNKKRIKGLSNKLVFNQVSQFFYIKKTHKYYQYIMFRLLFFFIRIPFLFMPSLKWNDKKRYFSILTRAY